MSVPNQTPYNIYTANGLTTVFTYEFYVISASDLQISINGSVVASGYTVAGIGNKDGGDITFLTPPANGAVVMLERVVPTYRLTDYQDNGDLLADTVNKDVDRIWMAIQRAFIDLGFALTRPFLGGPFNAKGYRIENLADPVNDQDAATKKFVLAAGNTNLVRTLRVPESYVDVLPSVAARRNSLLGWNNSGQPVPIFSMTETADLAVKLASDEEGLGDAMLAVKQPFDGAVSRTQHDKNAESMSIMDAGGMRDAFDPLSYETLARARATELRIPYMGYDQFMLPGMGLKIFKFCDGPYDRAPVVAIRNMMDPDDPEPQSSIAGFANSAALALNPERGAASLYVHHVAQPLLFGSSNTTFTADSVTCADLTAETISKIRVKQIINVTEGSATWSSFVLGIIDDTIYIEDAWYKVGSTNVTGTPADGSAMKLVPNNKSWGANIISSLNENSDSNILVGIELNTINNKSSAAGQGYGLDVVSNGAHNVGQAYQARGKVVFGFRNYANHVDGTGGYGFANTPASGNTSFGFYDVNSTQSFHSWGAQYGFTAKNIQSYALRVIDNSNNFITGMDSSGAWQTPKEYATTTAIGAAVSGFAGVTFATPAAAGDAIIMPTRMKDKKLTVKNLSTTYALTLTGPFEFGAGSFSIPARGGVILETDGTYWYVLAKYTA